MSCKDAPRTKKIRSVRMQTAEDVLWCIRKKPKPLPGITCRGDGVTGIIIFDTYSAAMAPEHERSLAEHCYGAVD